MCSEVWIEPQCGQITQSVEFNGLTFRQTAERILSRDRDLIRSFVTFEHLKVVAQGPPPLLTNKADDDDRSETSRDRVEETVKMMIVSLFSRLFFIILFPLCADCSTRGYVCVRGLLRG